MLTHEKVIWTHAGQQHRLLERLERRVHESSNARLYCKNHMKLNISLFGAISGHFKITKRLQKLCPKHCNTQCVREFGSTTFKNTKRGTCTQNLVKHNEHAKFYEAGFANIVHNKVNSARPKNACLEHIRESNFRD